MSYRYRYIIILGFFFITTFASAQSYKVNSNGGLNLRESASKDSKTISSLPDGTKVTVIDKSNDNWWKVKVDGKTGYVSSSFLKEDKSKNNNNTTSSSSGNSSKSNSSSTSSSKTNSSGSKSSNASSSSNAPGSWAAGVRLGDPLGLTVKKYLQRNRAFEINFGKTTYWGYDYRDRFYHHKKFRDYDYNGYAPKGAVALQFHYLYHKDIANAEGLQWYLGFGPQLKIRTYSFHYGHTVQVAPNDYRYVRTWENVSDIDLGLDGVIGMEYKFPNSSISMFGELNLFMEIFDKPLHFGGQGGIGLRFHF